MCGYCEWGAWTPDEYSDPAVAEERQRVSQNLWSQLMQEIEKADAEPEPPSAKA